MGSRFLFLKSFAFLSSLALLSSCSLFKTRPVQEMSDTAAAMKAAKDAQADIIAPVLYREANEWWQQAKTEYKYKNFEEAEEYAIKARKLAEQAEFEVLKNPGQHDAPPPEATTPPEPASTSYPYPSPTGTPYERAMQNAQQGAENGTSPNQTPTPAPSAP
jgi:hypothetical protein